MVALLSRAPRVLALATTLAVSITCVNPESPAKTTTSGGDLTPAAVADIVVAIAATTINTGGTTSATAVLRDSAGHVLTGRAITWASSAPTVATVDAVSGSVEGVAEGAAEVVAASEGVTGRAGLLVHAPVASVSAWLGSPSLVVGASTMAGATARDANGQPLPRTMTWTSSNTAVATVDANSGEVSAVAPGTANIRATSEGVMAASAA